MASKSPLPRLDDIRDAIKGIEDTLQDISFEAYKDVRQIRRAVEREIEIISEASRHIPDNLKAQYPNIPWRQVANIGNVLRHEYMEVAPDIIWAVVQDRLPELKQAVDSMVETAENEIKI